jgi:hypothetical protein
MGAAGSCNAKFEWSRSGTSDRPPIPQPLTVGGERVLGLAVGYPTEASFASGRRVGHAPSASALPADLIEDDGPAPDVDVKIHLIPFDFDLQGLAAAGTALTARASRRSAESSVDNDMGGARNLTVSRRAGGTGWEVSGRLLGRWGEVPGRRDIPPTCSQFSRALDEPGGRVGQPVARSLLR